MSDGKRISAPLLDKSLLDLITSSLRIMPVEYSFIEANENPYGWEYVIVVTQGAYKNHIYVWDNGWTLIGANDVEIFWSDIQNPPLAYKPIAHRHQLSDIDDIDTLPTQADLNKKVDKVDGKVLSDNNFSDDDKLKLDSLSNSATIDYTAMANKLKAHEENTTVHVTEEEHAAIATIGNKADQTYVNKELGKKVDSGTFEGHTGNMTIHVTQTEKDVWNSSEQNANDYTDEQIKKLPPPTPEITISKEKPTTNIWYQLLE